MANKRPSEQGTTYSNARYNKNFNMTATDYRQAALDDLRKLETKYNQEGLAEAKRRIDAEFDYRQSKIKKQQALDEAYAKNKIKLQQKYNLDDDPAKWEKRYKQKLDKQLAADKKYIEAKAKLEEQAELNLYKKLRAEAKRSGAGTVSGMVGSGSLLDWTKWRDFSQQTSGLTGGQKFSAVLDGVLSGLSNLAKQLETTIDQIGSYQGKWDTRLYGYSGANYQSITRTVNGAAALSPFLQQSKIMQNIDSLVQAGIAYNVEQRGFLQTIAEKIATTFDAANGTLLQLVRVQQADTTAARLGLEAGVTKYLNNMFANSEYMSSLYKTVLGNIYEATSQFGGQDSIGFEYQVQKWLGSLYSVGMSSGSISNIASAIGQLGSGNISALSGNSAMQNLLVMAASRGGLSYADLLTGGLSGNSVNSLMQGLVTYLAEIANSNNNVVKSQYAGIFGMSLSDLKAISNLASSVNTIARSGMNYSGAMGNLFNMANSIGARTSMGEISTNMWSNLNYSMASGIASNPALYAILKVAGLLDTVAGGIALPDIKYLGTGVNLQTSVADLMRVGALSGGILSSIAQMVMGGGAGFSGSGMLKAFGVNAGNLNTVTRGTGIGFGTSGESVSQSNYIGNASSTDIQSGVVGEAETDANQKLIQMQQEDNSVKLEEVNNNIVKIYNILNEGILRVSVTDFEAGATTAMSGAFTRP